MQFDRNENYHPLFPNRVYRSFDGISYKNRVKEKVISMLSIKNPFLMSVLKVYIPSFWKNNPELVIECLKELCSDGRINIEFKNSGDIHKISLVEAAVKISSGLPAAIELPEIKKIFSFEEAIGFMRAGREIERLFVDSEGKEEWKYFGLSCSLKFCIDSKFRLKMERVKVWQVMFLDKDLNPPIYRLSTDKYRSLEDFFKNEFKTSDTIANVSFFTASEEEIEIPAQTETA